MFSSEVKSIPVRLRRIHIFSHWKTTQLSNDAASVGGKQQHVSAAFTFTFPLPRFTWGLFSILAEKKTERTKSMRRLFNPSSLLTNLLTFQLYYSLLGGKNIKGWKCTGKTGNVGEMIRSWWCSLEWDGKKQLFSTKSRSDMRFCQCWPSLSSSHGQLLQKGSFSFCEQYPTAARLKTLLRPSES